jgi:acrylyl-CoA reductase (NADPH)
MNFPALLVSARGERAVLRSLPPEQLPAGEVLVRVCASSLNYKDALAVTATAPVVRSFPMVPGIDLGGVVLESTSPLFHVGDEIISTGSGLGESHWGGYAGMARIPAAMALRPPPGLTLHDAMAFGTAGLTAMLCVMALERHGLPARSAVLVSGATGGVGSLAVMLLAKAGHEVCAVTGKAEHHGYLRELGAHTVQTREQLKANPEKTLLAERYAGAVDTVGGDLLAALLRSISTGGAVAACGMAAGGSLPATVYPFILRGVALQGIACSLAANALKLEAWTRLAQSIPSPQLQRLTTTITLEQVGTWAQEMLASRVRGRVLVELSPR